MNCDCGAAVASEDGPSHAYMSALPACWRSYGELMARLSAHGVSAPLHMDAYAAQHPGNALQDRRQRGSVAVHLIVLGAHFDFGLPLSHLFSVKRQFNLAAARWLARLARPGTAENMGGTARSWDSLPCRR
ncbi:DUF5946 family protein [Deinococcus sp. SL84]|uniref:DUF5946 family protein n=1 Tax=Deinococcus sp. SL84 TaxID=2994663 RepID=UPI00227230C7|nr:DUF5946 family protein [Deinococcus sp. SL84]MCY1702729.1 DUF5946 family protein [Deinococcus sp. SL84]